MPILQEEIRCNRTDSYELIAKARFTIPFDLYESEKAPAINLWFRLRGPSRYGMYRRFPVKYGQRP